MPATDAAQRRPAPLSAMAPKVPHVAALFWGIKLLTTGMGEAISDWWVSISQFAAVGIGFIGFVIAITLQLRADRYRPALYWSTVAMVAIFGTMAADAVHVVLGIPYTVTTIGYALAVVGVLYAWKRVEGSVSIHSITTRRREAFYWAAVLATFALGTAAGDWSAFTLHLGYLASAALFGALILLPLIGWRIGMLGAVSAFWIAYVLTRPLGASLADWFGKPTTKGHGLGFGDDLVSIVALVVFAAIIVWVDKTGVDQPRSDEPA